MGKQIASLKLEIHFTPDFYNSYIVKNKVDRAFVNKKIHSTLHFHQMGLHLTSAPTY